MDQEIVDYILQAEHHGLTEFEIKQNLLNAGWEAASVEQGFVFAKAADSKTPQSWEKQQPSQNQAMSLASQAIKVESVTPAVSLSEQSFSSASSGSKVKKPLVTALVAVCLFLLAGAAFGYYKYIYVNPVASWSKFLKTSQSAAYNNQFEFSYSDPGKVGNSSAAAFFSDLKNIKLNFSGQAYVDSSDASNLQSHSTINYTFSSGNSSLATGIEYILSSNILYLKVGDNPILKMLGTMSSNGKPADWVKLDLDELSKADNGSQDAEFLKQFSDPDFKNQLEKIWQDSNVIKQDKYIGKETISGQETLHFKNSIDKTAFKDLINKYIDALKAKAESPDNKISDDDVATAKEIISKLIDKIEVKQFETWIGKKDSQLYKVTFVSNAPSFISLVNNADSLDLSGGAKDAKRVADIRQMASALELYYNDFGGYPDGLGGKPLNMTPNYIGQIPTAPAKEGTCTDYFNSYWYKPAGTKRILGGKTVYSSYQMTFCLAADYGTYKAGIGKLSPEGIQDNIECPATPDLCVSPSGTNSDDMLKTKVQKFVDKIDFSAEFKIDSTYTDYGKKTDIILPNDAVDLLSAQGSAMQKSNDAKRVSDIRYIASAQEMYFNDNNSYPANINLLVPKYLTKIPVAPEADGTICTQTDNDYIYKRLSPEKYTLTFCISNSTGGYSSGKHTLTQAGIE